MNRKSMRTLLVLSAIAMAMIVSPAVVSYPTAVSYTHLRAHET